MSFTISFFWLWSQGYVTVPSLQHQRVYVPKKTVTGCSNRISNAQETPSGLSPFNIIHHCSNLKPPSPSKIIFYLLLMPEREQHHYNRYEQQNKQQQQQQHCVLKPCNNRPSTIGSRRNCALILLINSSYVQNGHISFIYVHLCFWQRSIYILREHNMWTSYATYSHTCTLFARILPPEWTNPSLFHHT